MKKLVSLLVIAVLAVHYTGAVSTRRRRAAGDDNNQDGKDSGVTAAVTSGLNAATYLPGVGGLIGWAETWVADTFNAFEDSTNGLIARILSGALPCQITESNGITCTGVSKEGNFVPLIMGIVNQGPLPDIIKLILETGLTYTLEPAVNMILGGVTIPKS